MKYLYLIDHPCRDLPAYCHWLHFCEYHAEDEVYLCPSTSISKSTLLQNKFDAVVWNFARPQNISLIEFAHSIGIYNIIHDTEGIPYLLTTYYTNLSPHHFKAIDEIWAWGLVQKRHLEQIVARSRAKTIIRLTGSIRYEAIKSYKSILEGSNPIVGLWNTNYPILAPRYQSVEKEFRELVDDHKYYSERTALEFMISLAHERSCSCSKINEILKSSNSIRIRLRAHPFEDAGIYNSLMERSALNKIEFSERDDIHSDIADVSFILQSGCQTVLDAFIRGVPAFLLGHKDRNIWSAVSIPLNDNDLDKLSDFSFLRQCFEKQRELFKRYSIHEYLHNLDEFLSLSAETNSDISGAKSYSLRLRYLIVRWYRLAVLTMKSGAISMIRILSRRQRAQQKHKLTVEYISNYIASNFGYIPDKATVSVVKLQSRYSSSLKKQ